MMFKKLLNRTFPRRKGKRAVSPVIATILIIALTVTAGAIVYFIVVPMLKGKGELVPMSGTTTLDGNGDGEIDTATVTLVNIGSASVTITGVSVTVFSTSSLAKADLSAPVKNYELKEETYTWDIVGDGIYAIQDQKVATFETNNSEEQLSALSQYEITLSYSGRTLSLGRQFTPVVVSGSTPGGNETADYLSSELVYRTSSDDPSTSRGTFPTTGGYSPTLWFFVGIFKSGTSNLHQDSTDYISLNGFGNAYDYQPYIGTTDEFDTEISSHTGYSVTAYNDSGRYPGCVTFRGTSFDADDNIDFPQRGIVYMFSYLYNPTASAMDLSLSVQCDDAYYLWFNGEFLSSGTQSSNGWKTWRAPHTITVNPGYNIITFRAADAGGNWDAQALLWDTGTTDDITELLNVWPLEDPAI